MLQVNLLLGTHQGIEKIFIRYAPSKELDDVIKRIRGVKWSQQYKCWFVPLDRDTYTLLCQHLHAIAEIDAAKLRVYLTKRKSVKSAELPPFKPEHKTSTIPVPLLPSNPAVPPLSVSYRLSYENLQAIEQTVKLLILKAYSYSTVRTYRGELLTFFQALGKWPANQLTIEDIKRYLLKCVGEGLSENTIHSRINALKFYYEKKLGYDKFFFQVPRPKKPQLLPRVLGEAELTRLFNVLVNKKHKAILFTAYSAGVESK